MRGLLPSRGESWFGLLVAALLFSVFSLRKGKKTTGMLRWVGGAGDGHRADNPSNSVAFISSWEQMPPPGY